MTVSRIAGFFSNAGSPAPSGNFGPYTMTGLVKLVAAKVNINNIPPIGDVTDTSTVADPSMIGMQVQFEGDGPFSLPADAFSVNFLDFMPFGDTEAAAAWAPSTDTAGFFVGGRRSLRWAGQKYFGAALDFYVTWGSTYTSADQTYAGYYEVTYITA